MTPPPAPPSPPAPPLPPPGVHRLARSLESGALPAYLYDLDALREHARAVRAALPDGVELYYAAKANPEPEILTALLDHVDGYEVSSGGELAHVAHAVPGRPLAFSGPGKTPDEIASALRLGVARFHVESAHELAVLAALTARTGTRAQVLLRFNLAVEDGLLHGSALAMGGRPAPFGIDPAEADAVLRTLTDGSRPRLEFLGVHAHLASGLTAERQLTVAASVLRWSAALAARHGVELREVNIGGGMAVDYARPDETFDWRAYGRGLARLREDCPGRPLLRIEPGRALTVYSGWYATEVLDVKHSHGEDFAVVRGGTHHLRTPATKGHDQPCAVLPVADWPHPWPRPKTADGPVTLVGQLCTPKDVLARSVPVPGGLRAGDRVLFAMAGAYAWNISHHDFLMHPRPGFHFLSDRTTRPGGAP
ncbi:diaminopimelate decarboxylase [Streptomyces inusitatus]|uniref:Diaminopimelate decarboxylase n=1 Tax=Streptomyces inusitatus TaxID=68221 RepID=A0A918V0M8_9ACTN|nr:type III PLP-dependent enzyme [Streptomyces inusitatus]GGZ49447.1 diaminopimelate decarboxylase [Streptomyces inusitatus]